jgi:hypothetical protein
MRTRFGLSLGAFLLVAAAAFVTLWFAMAPTHRITEENVQKISRGMTLEHVVEILGVPAGDYSTRKATFVGHPTSGLVFIHDDEPCKTWTSNDAQVGIHFDDNECVNEVFRYWRWSNESWWAMLCRWMRLGR